jgi:hypothetical protein
MSAFERALNVAHRSAKRLDGIWVTYRPKGRDQFRLFVSPGETRIEQATSEGDGLVYTRVRDYIITLADLRDTLAGKFVPKTGDVILEEVDGQIHQMELLPLVANGNAWRWHGPTHDALRVHTKQISTEEA